MLNWLKKNPNFNKYKDKFICTPFGYYGLLAGYFKQTHGIAVEETKRICKDLWDKMTKEEKINAYKNCRDYLKKEIK